MNACPRIILLAVRALLRPRIGRSRALSRWWSHSTRLFAYCSVLCSASVATAKDQNVDDLAVLVDRPVDVTPDAGDFDVGLIYEPSRPDDMAAWSGRVDAQRREPLHPTKQGDLIDFEAALSGSSRSR